MHTNSVSKLVPLGGHTPVSDCSIRVTQTNLTALIECASIMHLELDRHVPAQPHPWLCHCAYVSITNCYATLCIAACVQCV